MDFLIGCLVVLGIVTLSGILAYILERLLHGRPSGDFGYRELPSFTNLIDAPKMKPPRIAGGYQPKGSVENISIPKGGTCAKQPKRHNETLD